MTNNPQDLNIQGFTKVTFPYRVSLLALLALTHPTLGRAENKATNSSQNLGRFLYLAL